MFFSELTIDKDLLRGIDEAGYKVCTPVQEETFTHTFSGKDVSVQSQTGTGKTAAFLISLFNMMLADKENFDKALIIAPTRELASQIEVEARLLGLYLPFSIGTFYGGVGYGRQEQLLKDGVDIIVATPGRLLDFVQQGKIQLHSIGYLIIDEADRLFDMGFLPDLKKILKHMRPTSQRQTMLFSATLSYNVRRLAAEYMNEPAEIEITPKKLTVDKVAQELYHVGHTEKLKLLLGLLAREKPENCIIFVNMKSTAEELAERLSMNGIQAEFLSGDLTQSRRERTVEQFKKGEISLLIATDVAARGLHVDDLELVINFDLPEDSENYIHRIGRTARAGKSGKAISLACEQTVEALPGIEKRIGMRIPVIHAEEELYLEDISKGKKSSRRRNTGNNDPRRTGTGRSRQSESRSKSTYQNRTREQQRSRPPRRDQQEIPSDSTAANLNKKPNRSYSQQRTRNSQPTVERSAPVKNSSEKQKPQSFFKRIVSMFKR